MRLSFFAAIILFVFPALALGEYRAYELTIANTTTGKTRTVTSTLDQYQYPEYHHLANGDTATYVTSWMCYGRTSNHQAICGKPDAAVTPPTPAQNPGSVNPADPALQSPAK